MTALVFDRKVVREACASNRNPGLLGWPKVSVTEADAPVQHLGHCLEGVAWAPIPSIASILTSAV